MELYACQLKSPLCSANLDSQTHAPLTVRQAEVKLEGSGELMFYDSVMFYSFFHPLLI